MGAMVQVSGILDNRLNKAKKPEYFPARGHQWTMGSKIPSWTLNVKGRLLVGNDLEWLRAGKRGGGGHQYQTESSQGEQKS